MCGQSLGDRIFGGNATGIDQYPWTALLQYTRATGGTGFLCGGSLIHERYVVTAAHCIKDRRTSQYELSGVRLGEWDLRQTVDCDYSSGTLDCIDPPLDIPIEEKIVHERYTPQNKNQYNDIALLRLSRAVKFTHYVQPICLPVANELRARTNVGEELVAVGWGATELARQSAVKLAVGLNGVDINTCQTRLGSLNIRVAETQLCAGGEQGKDSCNGDSGGPLMAHHKDNQGQAYWYLAGLTSFGLDKCGTKGFPGVYTRLTSYVDWIESKIRP